MAISNIAWGCEQDTQVYEMMKKYGFAGLEIAPTRIFEQQPYDRLDEAKSWAESIKKEHGLQVASLQSIWYGRQENIFRSQAERELLLAYTEKAIDFAVAAGAENLVFGCPKNRSIPARAKGAYCSGLAMEFFCRLGEYAAAKGVFIGLEANPPMYQTNYLNNTDEVIDLLMALASPGLKLNLDVGTMIANDEVARLLEGKVRFVSHVHVSEPGLQVISKRSLHRELAAILAAEGYSGFVSVEMGKVDDIAVLEKVMLYVREVFG